MTGDKWLFLLVLSSFIHSRTKLFFSFNLSDEITTWHGRRFTEFAQHHHLQDETGTKTLDPTGGHKFITRPTHIYPSLPHCVKCRMFLASITLHIEQLYLHTIDIMYISTLCLKTLCHWCTYNYCSLFLITGKATEFLSRKYQFYTEAEELDYCHIQKMGKHERQYSVLQVKAKLASH